MTSNISIKIFSNKKGTLMASEIFEIADYFVCFIINKKKLKLGTEIFEL
jgi:hypothetical protein